MSEVLASSWSLVAWLGLVIALVQLVRAHRRAQPPKDALSWTWRGTALLGFALTWTFMIRMALADIALYPSFGAWSRESNLFFDAYRRVTSTPPAWWWSQHLMAWALAGSLWFAVEGRRRALRSWAYLWLAMCVAVSVALPVFAQRMRAHPSVADRDEVPVATMVGIVLAALALAATPFVAGAPFIAAMLVLHAGLLVPALAPGRGAAARGAAARAVEVRPIAVAVAAGCFALHVVATVRLRDTPLGALIDVVRRDPAQASISSDVVLTWLACTLLVAMTSGRRRALAFFVLAPCVSLGAAFAWAVLLRPPPPREGEAA